MRPVPPIYPWSAFDSVRWMEANQVPIVPRRPAENLFHLHCPSEEIALRFTSEFDRVVYERVGVLRGEYLVFTNGLILADREGAFLSVNFPHEASAVARMPYEYLNTEDVWDTMEIARKAWETYPLIEHAAVFSHIYHGNYYHFCFEFLQKFRLVEPLGVKTILTSPLIYERRVYREAIVGALGDRVVAPTDKLYRVKDPVIAQTYQSDEGLKWLRRQAGRTAASAGKRYFVTRAAKPTRSNNNIAETDAFRQLLDRHGFIRVDFGEGELSIAEQVEKLEGASMVLASHGAGLTNLAYLNAPARVIEIFGRKVISTSFVRISEALGLEHHAIVSEESDAQRDILVDCELLERLITAPLKAPAS